MITKSDLAGIAVFCLELIAVAGVASFVLGGIWDARTLPSMREVCTYWCEQENLTFWRVGGGIFSDYPYNACRCMDTDHNEVVVGKVTREDRVALKEVLH